MKNRLLYFTGLICTFVFLLLQPLVATSQVNARQTLEVIPSEPTTIGSIDPLTAGSENGPITAGWQHACALTPTGGVMCWGDNDYGQLGNNSTIDSHIPVYVAGLSSGVKALAAGVWHTCALTTTGGVLCWGGNLSGQLGNNTFFTSHIPVNVWELSSGVSAIAAGFYHTCALTTSGGMMCWGYNGYGQLGNNLPTNGRVPSFVVGLSSGVSAIAAGFYHTCAVTAPSGGVKCWGRNNYGQLGNNSTTNSPIPIDVSGLSSGISAVTTGDNFTCALTSIGKVKCWGLNGSGQLGNDTTTQSLIPMDANEITDVVNAIAAGGMHTCILTSTGGVKCWGNNIVGGYENPDFVNHYTPADATGLTSGVNIITSGQYFSCALTAAGGMKCWGTNNFGQLGNNSTTTSYIPVDVLVPAPPQLTINYNNGLPGSYFTFTGENFPASSAVSISINSHVFTDTVSVNATGGFTFIISTTNADVGFYTISASSINRSTAEAMESQVETSANPGAATFLLDDKSPLRLQSGTGQILSVPIGLGIPPHWLYLPSIIK